MKLKPNYDFALLLALTLLAGVPQVQTAEAQAPQGKPVTIRERSLQ
jgi:hypothetical protein